MKILLTGGAGFIGSHTCTVLQEAGHEVILLDNFLNSNPLVIDRIQKISGKSVCVAEADLRNGDAVLKIFMKYKPEAVIHFAGLKSVNESISNPISYYVNNIFGTLNLLKAMTETHCRCLVFSSSATVYDSSAKMPLKEDSPLKTSNPYGYTKLVIENILSDLYLSEDGWKIAILRYFNPVGAHSSGLIGEFPNGIPNNLMPYMLQVALGKLDHLNIFGNDYLTKDGTCIRDYIHVMDLAEGHLAALNWLSHQSNPILDTFNFGTGCGYSVLDMIHSFTQATNVDISYVFADRRSGDIPISYANPYKATTTLNWKASRTIRDMCVDAWNWQKLNPDGY